MNTYFGRLAGALLCASAGLVLSAGCAQNEGGGWGRQASASSSGSSSQDRISTPPPNPSRGGGSPAVRASASARPDGGTDVRTIGQGNAQYTLAYPTGDRNTSIVLLEAAGPQQVRVGQPYSYQLRVTNLTDTPLHNVRVRDLSNNAGFDETGTSPDARAAAERDAAAATTGGAANNGAARRPSENTGDAPGTWTIGMLQPKQTVTRQFRGVADEVGTLSNCLAVQYEPTLCIAVQAVKPELQVTKEGPSEVLICQDINYSYRVTNTGSGTARAVVVTDTLPEGLATDKGERQVALNAGDLRQGESKQATVRVRATRTGRFASRAEARSGDAAPAAAAAEAAAGAAQGTVAQSRSVETLVREPVLAVDVEGPEAQYVGQAVNFRVTVRNTGDAPANNTVVRLSPTNAAERPTERQIGTIEPGQARTFQVTTTVAAAPTAPNMQLAANAEAQCAKPVTASAAVAIRTVPALLLECVDTNDPVTVGQNTTYTIVVRNQGSGPDTNVRLRATLPPELRFVRGGGATPVSANGQEISFGPVATLPAKADATWTVEVTAQRAGDVQFKLEMQSDAIQQPSIETEPTKLINPAGGAAEDPAAKPAGLNRGNAPATNPPSGAAAGPRTETPAAPSTPADANK